MNIRMTNRLVRSTFWATVLAGVGLMSCSCHSSEDFSGSGELAKSQIPKAAPTSIGGGAPQGHAPVSVVQHGPHP